jgi:hypothetical protein
MCLILNSSKVHDLDELAAMRAAEEWQLATERADHYLEAGDFAEASRSMAEASRILEQWKLSRFDIKKLALAV